MRRFSQAAMGSSIVGSATVTHRLSHVDSSNVVSYQSAAFTPGASELLIVFVTATATTANLIMTDSQGLGFTLVTSRTKAAGDPVALFVSNALAAASSMTVTFGCLGDAATAAIIQVAGIAGMTRTGSSAIRQFSGEDNQGADTPNPVFTNPCLPQNPTLGCVGNNSNPAAVTEPVGWSEADDTGTTNPTTGAEYVYRNSGFDGTAITWGGASATAHGSVIVELNVSPP